MMTQISKITLLATALAFAAGCRQEPASEAPQQTNSPVESVLAKLPEGARFDYAIFSVDMQGLDAQPLIGPFPAFSGKRLKGTITLEIPGLLRQASGFETNGDSLAVDRPGGGQSVLKRGGVCYDEVGGECPESTPPVQAGQWWVDFIAPVNSQGVHVTVNPDARKTVEAANAATRFGRLELPDANLDQSSYQALLAAYERLPASFKFSGPNAASAECEHKFALEVVSRFRPAPDSTPRHPKIDIVPPTDRFDTIACDEPPF